MPVDKISGEVLDKLINLSKNATNESDIEAKKDILTKIDDIIFEIYNISKDEVDYIYRNHRFLI